MSDRPFIYRYLNALMHSGAWARLGGGHRGLLIAYLNFADSDGVAFPGTETLALLTGTNPRNVQRVRAELKAAELLELLEAGGGSKSGRWRLVIPPAHSATPTPGAVRRPSPPSPPAQDTGGTPGAGHPRRSATPPAHSATLPPAQRDAYPRRSAPSEHTSEQTNEHSDRLFGGEALTKKRGGKTGKTDLVWETVAEIWFGGEVSPPHRKRVGKLVRDFKDLNANPEEIRQRLDRYKSEWPKAEASPDALIKHWVRFAGKTAGDLEPETLSIFERKRAGESIGLHPHQQAAYNAWLVKQGGMGVAS